MYATRRPVRSAPRKRIFVPGYYAASVLTLSAFGNGTAKVANRAYYVPFSAPYDTGLVSISIYCVAQSGQNFDFGLYNSSGGRIASRGSTAISATGIRTWTPSTPLSLTAESQYYAAFATDSAAPTWAVFAGDNRRAGQSGVMVQDTAFPLPPLWSPPASTTYVGGPEPMLRLIFSD